VDERCALLLSFQALLKPPPGERRSFKSAASWRPSPTAASRPPARFPLLQKEQGLSLVLKDDDLVGASTEGVAVVRLEDAGGRPWGGGGSLRCGLERGGLKRGLSTE
jgi:hypothetical protein